MIEKKSRQSVADFSLKAYNADTIHPTPRESRTPNVAAPAWLDEVTYYERGRTQS